MVPAGPNIGMLGDSERDEVFAAFAPEPEHRVYGRGIRRRLAPMLGNDPRRVRLALALTMALPGTPVLMYGDEIGMGENLSLPGRATTRSTCSTSATSQARSTRGWPTRSGYAACPELGWGEWRTLDVGNARVLAIENSWRDGHLVTLHNLSAEPALRSGLPGWASRLAWPP